MEERVSSFYTSFRLRRVFVGGIFLFLLAGYIIQVNASSTKAYALRDAQIRYEELVQSQDRLTAEIHRLQSLSSVMERQAFLDLVPVQEISYLIHVDSDTVALK